MVKGLNVNRSKNDEESEEEEIQWNFGPDAELSQYIQWSSTIDVNCFNICEDYAPGKCWKMLSDGFVIKETWLDFIHGVETVLSNLVSIG